MLSWFPENISTYGHQIDHIFWLIYVIVGVWFLIAEGVLIGFLIRYRRRPGQGAVYEKGDTKAKLAWILVPVSLVFMFDIGIDFAQGPVWDEIKTSVPQNPDQVIHIQAKQFAWDFTVPGPDGKLGTEDDIATPAQLTVPVNKVIVFELEATDVIHSFWVPNLRLKQDAVPGRKIKGWFQATKAGTYPIGCAELCGIGHGTMKGSLVVLNDADYQKWVGEQSQTKGDDFWR